MTWNWSDKSTFPGTGGATADTRHPSPCRGGGTGGPVDSTLFYTLYLYKEGFANLNMGYASAMAWLLLLVIVGGLTAVNFFPVEVLGLPR